MFSSVTSSYEYVAESRSYFLACMLSTAGFCVVAVVVVTVVLLSLSLLLVVSSSVLLSPFVVVSPSSVLLSPFVVVSPSVDVSVVLVLSLVALAACTSNGVKAVLKLLGYH